MIMICSIDLLILVKKISPLVICRYLDETGWKVFPFKRNKVRIYQYEKDDIFEQADVPLSKELIDYKQGMYRVVRSISVVEKKLLSK